MSEQNTSTDQERQEVINESYTFDFNISGMMLCVDFSEVESVDGKKVVEVRNGPITHLELLDNGSMVARVTHGYPFPRTWIVRRGMEIFRKIKYIGPDIIES